MKHVNFKFRLSIFLVVFCGIFSTLSLSAQSGSTINVKGNVKDTQGEALIGAAIQVVGTTTQGTVSDFDGNFSLNVASNGTLKITYTGYETQTISVGGKTDLTIVMKDDRKVLDELVVIGYGTVKKNDATGAVTAIKAEEMNKGLTISAADMLVGKVAGVNVNSEGGEPGAGSKIRIRGGSSLLATNEPLIIVDGLPMNPDGPIGTNPLSTINPADIETFTVLKDASSTAIYGSRASNGVIIITTKKGSKGKAKVSYNGNVSVSQNIKQLDVLSADELRAYVDENYSNYGALDKLKATLGAANTDWQDEIYRTAISTDHNLTILGTEGEIFPYRISMGYTNQDGVLRNSNYERFTGGVSLTPHTKDNHLNIAINAKGTYSIANKSDQGAIGTALTFDPTQPVKNGSPFGGYYTWLSGEVPNSLPSKNPVALIDRDMKSDVYKTRAFIGNAQFDYKLHFLPELRFNMNVGLEYSDSQQESITSPNSPMGFTEGGSTYNNSKILVNKLFEFYTQYEKDLKGLDSHFDIMAGYSWQHFQETGSNQTRRIVSIPGKDDQIAKYYPWKNEVQLISFFGRLNYSLMDKYLLTATIRRDGSSRFSSDNRWGIFPAAGFAWKVSEESFLKNVKPLNELKFRLGWGITGQQNLGDYKYPSQQLYEESQGQAEYYLNGEWISVVRPTAALPNLKWEETTTYNAGLDYGLLGNRIYGSVDVYRRITNDLLNNSVKVPIELYYRETVPMNIGSMENNGLEFSINAKPIVTRNFTWDVGYNIAFNRSEITELTTSERKDEGRREGDVGNGYYVQLQKTGYAPNMFNLYEQVYDSNGMPIEGAYVDRNSDGIIDEGDAYLYKKAAPDVTMGFNSKITLGNFDFGFNTRVALGNYVYNSVAAQNGATSATNMFQGDYTRNILSSAAKTKFDSKQVLSDYYVQNASFLKVDNITLGYSFTKIFRSNIGGRFYGTVQNPICWTKYDGIDPEIASGGIDNNIYPRPLTVIFGVNLNF